MSYLQCNEVDFFNNRCQKDLSKLPREDGELIISNLRMRAWGIIAGPALEITPLKYHVGPKAFEMKINGSPAKRCVYVVLEGSNKVLVLHVFEKTCNGVDKKNMDVAKARYKLWQQQSRKAA